MFKNIQSFCFLQNLDCLYDSAKLILSMNSKIGNFVSFVKFTMKGFSNIVFVRKLRKKMLLSLSVDTKAICVHLFLRKHGNFFSTISCKENDSRAAFDSDYTTVCSRRLSLGSTSRRKTPGVSVCRRDVNKRPTILSFHIQHFQVILPKPLTVFYPHLFSFTLI